MRREDRERTVVEVVERVVEDRVRSARSGEGPSVEDWILDTLFEEERRLDREEADRERERARIEELRKRTVHASPAEQERILRDLTDGFVQEIVGNFDERVYDVATRFVPRGLALLLNATSPWRLLTSLPQVPSLETNVTLIGETDLLESLAMRGTVILVPTHSSNLDSVVIGWALYRLGLPPFVYGAGLNLFTNPLISFFMHNLGAYKVDRKKDATLYKDCLKEYATVSLELGYDHLFFPGGTRSRSGAVEDRLKLGLLGCGLRAYINNLRSGRDDPEVFIVPATINYELVLEAETLIDDHLRRAGKARYIIEDDESSQLRRVIEFGSSLLSLDARIYIAFSKALDPFGNEVRADGQSYDARGRPVDISRYVLTDGEPGHEFERDAEYTRELGRAISRAYRRDTVLASTHVVAYVAFRLLRSRDPDMDLYRFLRSGARDAALPLGDLALGVDRVMGRLRSLAEDGKVRIDPRIRKDDGNRIVSDALWRFGTYHREPALRRRGDRVVSPDRNLLYYYGNRARGYGLDEALEGEEEEAGSSVRATPRPEEAVA